MIKYYRAKHTILKHTVIKMECSICYENINEQKTLKCGHSFCKHCISKWSKKSNTCPCCRKKIKNSCDGCMNGCEQCKLSLIKISELLNEIDDYFHQQNIEEIRVTMEIFDLCRSLR